MREAVLFQKLENDNVSCLACEWKCQITPGMTGRCGVRKNIDGQIYLVVDSRPVAVNIDPMEKKPLYHFLPGQKIFSLGTVGCNFACDFCQNYDISQYGKHGKKEGVGLGEGWWSPEKVVEFCLEKNIGAIAFTYNEPTIFSEYAGAVMEIAKKNKIAGVYVSNGYMTLDTLDYLENYIDAYNIDLKAFSEKYYDEMCHAKLAPVKRNIEEIHRRGKWLEVTTLLIPGKNNEREELVALANWLAKISPDIPWHLSAFFPTYKLTETKPTELKELKEAYAIGKDAGLKYVYLGNVGNGDESQTHCPNCGELVIVRDYPSLVEVKLDNGKCEKCREKIAGVWK